MRSIIQKAVLVLVVVGTSGVFAPGAQTAAIRSGVSSTTKCARLKLTAKPGTNTAMVPETIKSRVRNCSPTTETVTLIQSIAGPSAAAQMAKMWKIKLRPGQTVVKTRSFPYACCGTYTVTDKVLSRSGKELAKATASFTFA
jgi:hypothetical protein